MPTTEANPLYIEFDGRQLTFTTGVLEVREFVTTTFRHMLVPAPTSSVGEVSLERVGGGYELRGRETIFLGGTPVEPILHFVKDEVRLQFLRSRTDLLWLHAGAVEREGSALLLSGPSGQGKSTLATLMSRRGWSYLSDDVVPVRMNDDRAIPFPQTPSRRLHPGREVTPGEMATLPREVATLEPAAVARGDAPIGAIVFITYEAHCASVVERLSKGDSAFAMFSNLTNFTDHRASAVERIVAFAKTIPMFSLRYSEPESAADALSRIWSEL